MAFAYDQKLNYCILMGYMYTDSDSLAILNDFQNVQGWTGIQLVLSYAKPGSW